MSNKHRANSAVFFSLGAFYLNNFKNVKNQTMSMNLTTHVSFKKCHLKKEDADWNGKENWFSMMIMTKMMNVTETDN